MDKCIFYRSVSKIEPVEECSFLCNKTCKIIPRYKELLNEGKIDIIDDLANFRVKDDKKKRSDYNYATSNRRNTKRTISKSRKKFKNKSK